MTVLCWLLGVALWAAARLFLEPLTEGQRRLFWAVTLGGLGVSNLFNGGTQPWIADGLWPFLVGGITAHGLVSVCLRWFPLAPRDPPAA